MIQLKKISKSFKENVLFNNVDLEFENGLKYQIVGENGSGKSVLLKLIVGYSLPTAGEVYIDKKRLGDEFDFLPDSGISIDAPQFMPQLTGMENLLELAKIKKITSKETILALSEKLKFKEDLHKKYDTYSLGMRQKMRIIQAIMENPKYLILDEPFDALDLEMKDTVKKLIDDYMTEDILVIFTSHDNESLSFSDKIIRIDNHQVMIDNGK